MQKTRKRIAVERSSGNVFADIGLPNPRKRQEKARLAFAINEVIRNRELSLGETARSLNVDRADVSALLNYRLKTFSVARLKEFLAKLGREG